MQELLPAWKVILLIEQVYSWGWFPQSTSPAAFTFLNTEVVLNEWDFLDIDIPTNPFMKQALSLHELQN